VDVKSNYKSIRKFKEIKTAAIAREKPSTPLHASSPQKKSP